MQMVGSSDRRSLRYNRAMPLERYKWSLLTKQQVGAYVEYFVKMELTMFGFHVYGTEVDDRGVDFIAQFGDGPFLKIQVKSVRDSGYVFMEKSKFSLHEHRLLAFGLLIEGQPPNLFLIPSLEWRSPNALLRDRDYGGELKSAPEWGMNISKKNLTLLAAYSFEKTARAIIQLSESSL
jgi:hypothetical protein